MVDRIGPLGSFQIPAEQPDQYLTQTGDTMAGLAQAFGVNEQALTEANPFIANPNGLLPPGVYLTIPKQTATGQTEVKRRQDEERQQQRQPEPDDEEDERLNSSQLETVSNNPIANTKRNYELSRNEMSLAALSLTGYDPGRTANPSTTGTFCPEHLIADQAFTNKSSISSAELQRLLHEKGSGLATYLLDDGRSAAQAITGIATASKINPQLLVVLLQREGGFIAGKYASGIDRYRLDWAFGFGGGHSPEFKGFDRQLETAARHLRQQFEQNILRVPTQLIMDGQRQRVENAATLALYQLAPQMAQARLFYQIWHGCFGPDGLGRLR